jgi:hypothetical protein
MSDSSERPSAFETRPVAGAKRPPTPRTAKEAAQSHRVQPKITRVRSTKSQQSAEALDEPRSQQISRQSSILSQSIKEDPETSEEETDEEMAHASTSAATLSAGRARASLLLLALDPGPPGSGQHQLALARGQLALWTPGGGELRP